MSCWISAGCERIATRTDLAENCSSRLCVRDGSIVTVVMALLITAVGTTRVQAQNALGDGRALDNNLRAGSGGVNQAQAPPAYLRANDVITGNVTGLGFFHDDVGYGSTNEFGDQLGSDDLFRFHARSLPVGVSPGTTGQPRVYRPLSSLGVGSVQSRSYTHLYTGSSSASQESEGVVVGAGPVGGVTPQPFLRWSQDATSSPSLSGEGLIPRGSRSMGASPLFGLGVAPARDLSSDRPVPERDDEVIEDPDDPAANPDTRPYRLDYSIRAQGPSLELGRQIQSKLSSQPFGQPGQAPQGRLDEIESMLFDLVESNLATPGQDVYLDLLRQIQQAKEDPSISSNNTGREGLGLNQLVPPPSDTAEPSPATDNQKDLAATWEPTDPRNKESPDAANDRAAQADIARRAARGLTPRGETPSPDATDESVGQDGAATPDLPDALQQLLDTLDYDLPRVTTLAGDRQDKINKLLRAAEADLSAGRYFKAESRYEQVVTLAPDYPLGRVGLIHAQLGAAMFHTAALNVRALFEQHPELIATRYGVNLLPSQDRLQWVEKELEKTLVLSSRGDAAIMLAYLGYQTEDPAMTRRGLDLAAQQNPADELLPLLRRIWLQNSTGGAEPMK